MEPLAANTLENPECIAAFKDDHLSSLKSLTEKLKLETKKSSDLDWRAQLEAMLTTSHNSSSSEAEKHASSHPFRCLKPSMNSGVFNEVRQPAGGMMGFKSIDQALEWLRKELVSCCFLLVLTLLICNI